MGRFVRISLATKLRLVFGAAVLGIIACALALPWYFVELMVEQSVGQPASWVTHLRLAEWVARHPSQPAPATMPSDITEYYQADSAGLMPGTREGPTVLSLVGTPSQLNSTARSARRALERRADAMYITNTLDAEGRKVFQCFRAIRAEKECMVCHAWAGGSGPTTEDAAAEPQMRRPPRFSTGQLVGLIHMSMPEGGGPSPWVWWARISIIAGGTLAALLAVVVFAVVTQRLILRPVRQLRDLSDKVAEGDLSVRTRIATGDELQRLGESFNEMLSAISDQHEKLRTANRALDLRLHELGEANVTLFQANKVKNEFLANVSHELRTPLNSIMGFADLVGQSDDERLRRYGQNIESAARALMAMINDLLDIARIEAGKAQVRLDKVSILDLCQTLATFMAPLADKKQIRLESNLDPQLPLVTTDGGKVQQILYNLLSNAVKFTPPGGKVTLSAAAGDEVTITVADTGPGIAESEQAAIFEKFYQSDRSLTRESQGAGLGLAISKELTALLGGRLSVRSTPGHGAEFTLTLPIEAK
jgi:signal transduction histidine kinase